MGQRRPLPAVGVVDQHGVALAERAPPVSWPAKPDVGALEQQRPERQRLGRRPVDLALVADHLVAGGELLGQLGVDVEVVGPAAERVVDAVERGPVDAGLDRRQARRWAAAARRPQVGRRCRLAGLVQRLLQLLLEVVERLLGLVEGELAPLDQRLGEQLAHRAPLVDLGVHQRLGVAGVVALVVAVAPVADQVDDHVLVEPLPVGVGQPGHPHAGLGVVAVDVEDRRLDDLGHVGRVEARPGGLGRGGEPDLVVDHDVDGAADPVALDVAHVERLGHHALAGEGGVAVHEDGQHRVGLGVVDLVLVGPHHALDHRVDGLEVAGVGGQLDLDAVAGPALELADLAEVVLHVARALRPAVGSSVPSNSLNTWS